MRALSPRRLGRLGAGLCLLFALLGPGWGAAAAGGPGRTAPPAQPTAPSDAAAGLRPAFAGDIAAHPDLPRYDLRIQLDPARRTLTGQAQIRYVNTTGAALDSIALRLYPNFPRDVFGRGGDVSMQVGGAAVDGRPVEPQSAAKRTAAILPLAEPLAPGASATLAISYTSSVRPASDGVWRLATAYPMLAVHDSDGWRLDLTTFADRVYATSALYRAAIRAPAGLTVAATGSTLAQRRLPDGSMEWSVVAGPVREFAFVAGDMVAARASADDVAVNVWTARKSRLDAGLVARTAAAALQVFERRFGPYPYRELDIHLLRGSFDGGDEYPGMIMITSGGAVGVGTRYVAAHEVAHQWWYGVVGNDIYRQPWLDEALAQYSGVIYAEDSLGPAAARADWEREVLRRYRGAISDGDRPIGLALSDYPSFNVYYRTIYGKGPVFLQKLRAELGDTPFFDGLRRYYAEQRYGVGTTAALRRAFEEASGRDLGDWFGRWVTGAP